MQLRFSMRICLFLLAFTPLLPVSLNKFSLALRTWF